MRLERKNVIAALLLRGLDALTNELSILEMLGTITALTIKNINVVRNHRTGISRGYAFVEMNSAEDGYKLLETIGRLQSPLEVDGKAILATYAKNTYSTL